MESLALVDDLIDANKIDLALRVAAQAVGEVQSLEQARATLARLTLLESRAPDATRRASLDSLIESLGVSFPELRVQDERRRIADEQRRVAEEQAARRGAEEIARKQLETRLLRLAQLSAENDDSVFDKALATAFRQHRALLLAAFDSGCAAFDSVTTTHLREYRQQMVGTVKALAVELLVGGASLDGLKADPVPLVAYALSAGRLPLGTPDDSTDAEERANDALLAHADVISRTSGPDRQVVLSLFRQGFLLGLADRYQKLFDLTY